MDFQIYIKNFSQKSVSTFIIIIGFLMIHSSLLQAQTVPDTLYQSTDTLVVEAARNTLLSEDAPISLSVYNKSREELAAGSSTSISSVTAQMPGIWVSNRQNNALGERITIRGLGWRAAFGVRGIQVVLDGIPLTVADGQSVTNIIDPSLVTHAELIRGPSGMYWGNSSGGVLYLSTKGKNAAKPIFISGSVGSYGEKGGRIRYSESYDNHRFNAYTSYKFEEGYRDYSTSKLLRSGITGSYELSDRDRIEYMGAFLSMPQAEHPSGLTSEQTTNDPRQANDAFAASDAGKQVSQGQVGLSYYRDSAAGLLNVTGYGIYRDLTNPLPFGIITVDRLAGGLRGTLEREIGKLKISGGAELKLQHDDREEFENNDGNAGATTVDQIESVSNEAIFLNTRYQTGPLTLLGSLRYDRISFSTDSAGNVAAGDRSFKALSPAVGVGYSIGTSTIYSNLSTSFEAPTTTELVNRPDGGNGFNPNLKPERTLGFEAGSRGSVSNGLITYDLAFYRLWISDLLFPYQLEANGPVFYRNQGETRHTGIEFSSSFYPSGSTSLSVTYTLTQAEFEEAQTLNNTSLTGNRVPGVPKHRLAGQLIWKPGQLRVKLSPQYVSSMPVDNLNSDSNDRYFITDTNISYTFSLDKSGVAVTPYLNVNNIFDSKYNGSVVVNAFGGRYFEPAPGRNWKAGISMNF